MIQMILPWPLALQHCSLVRINSLKDSLECSLIPTWLESQFVFTVIAAKLYKGLQLTGVPIGLVDLSVSLCFVEGTYFHSF